MVGNFRFDLVSVFAMVAMLVVAMPSEAQPKSTQESPEAIVVSLYHDYAWEVVLLSSNYVELLDQSKNELEKYFSPVLAQLLIKDRECKEKTNDVCGLDFDPIYATQDRSFVHDLDVKTPNSSNEVKVQFKSSGTLPAFELTYKMIKTASGWRIDDINYGAGRSTLRAVLEHVSGH